MLISQVGPEFQARRDELIRRNPGGVFLFPAPREVLRNPDVHFPFRQESNFYYLSGFEEPESFLVLFPDKAGPGARMVLFVRKRDPELEMWEGERHGTEGAQRIFGAHESYPIEELRTRLPELLTGADRVFFRFGQDEMMDRTLTTALESCRRGLGRSGRALPPIADAGETLGEMRLFKQPGEIERLRRACRITADAHRAAMRECRPGMNEAEIEALIDYRMRKGGCQRMGYGSIVAGGKNAACLHYRSNNEALRDGDLLLIDAGGEHDYYTSDITRTFPVGRAFSDAQAKVYDVVLRSQKEAIAMSRPGATLPAIHARACEVLTDGLLSLGLLAAGDAQGPQAAAALKRFYPHQTSHWLGMDVHDVGLYRSGGEPRKLEPGMCFTIEPGFYVQPGDKDAPAAFRNIGIRIEDDILVTAGDPDVLTKDAPKERADIEALRAY